MSASFMCSPLGRSAAPAFVLVVSLSGTAVAQQTARSFDQLQFALRLGDTVTVTDSAGREIKGMVADVTPASLVLLANGAKRELKQGDVERIRQRRRDSLRNGALWGFGSGAVLGLVIAALGAGADGGYANSGAALVPVVITGSLGGALGVGVDAVIEGQQVVYAPTPPAADVAGSRRSGRGRTAVLVTLRF